MMGHILKMLAEKPIDPKPSAWGHRLTIEDCEDIHLHYRNRRLEFSDREFLAFADCVTRAAQQLRIRRAGGTNTGMVLDAIKTNPVSDFWSTKFTIEANYDAYHLHLRDLRVDFYSDREFEEFAAKVVESYMGYIDYRLTGATRVCLNIPMVLVNPFDAAHRLLAPGEKAQWGPEVTKYDFMAPPNDEHNKRIEEVMEAMEQGKIIRPIACIYGNPILQRKDGFCRYWAHKLRGLKYIDCIIGRQTVPGVQGGKSFVVSEAEYQYLLAGEGY